MSDTAQLFMLAGIWTAGALVVAYFIPKWPAKIAAVALLVGIPFWELPYGYYNFRSQCAEKTRLQVLDRIPPQNSVCIAHFDVAFYKRLLQAGFDRVEVTERADNAAEYLSNGRLVLVERDKVASAYCIAFESNITQPWRILRADTLIVRASDNYRAATQSYLRWDGMWWQSQASPVLGTGGACRGDMSATFLALRQGT